MVWYRTVGPKVGALELGGWEQLINNHHSIFKNLPKPLNNTLLFAASNGPKVGALDLELGGWEQVATASELPTTGSHHRDPLSLLLEVSEVLDPTTAIRAVIFGGRNHPGARNPPRAPEIYLNLNPLALPSIGARGVNKYQLVALTVVSGLDLP